MATFVPYGLDKAPIDFISKSIAAFGFNCVRLPYSLELFYSDPVVTDPVVAKNSAMKGQKGMKVYDLTVKSLTDNGLMVILVNHVSKAGSCCSTTDGNGLWFNPQYPATKYFEAISGISERFKDNPLVVGNDLRNEPRPDDLLGIQPTWGSGVELNDWSMAAKKAGDLVHKVNPNMLILVQGFRFANYLLEV
jgi:endoglucanase